MPRGNTPPKHGRPKGSRNKATIAREQMLAEAAASGETPLAFMFRIYRDEEMDMKDRMWAAAQALPYCHSKMPTAVEHGGAVGLYDLSNLSEDALRELAATLERASAIVGSDTSGDSET